MRACKKFRALSVPLFYETIWISKEAQLKLLVDFLHAEHSYLHLESIGITSFIKRIVFTSFFPPFGARGPHLTISLIQLCPNINSLHFLSEITFIDPNGGAPLEERKLLQFLTNLPLSTLQVLNLRRLYPKPSSSELSVDGGIFKRAERLKVLRLDEVTCVSGEITRLEEVARSLFRLPNIEALAIPASLCFVNCPQTQLDLANHPVAFSDLPPTALKELILFGIRDAPTYPPLSPSSSPALQRISITTTSDMDFVHAWPFAGAWFPSIVHLDFVFNTWSLVLGVLVSLDPSTAHTRELELIGSLPPALQQLGLQARKMQSGKEACKFIRRFCELLSRHKRQGAFLKNLKNVQLLAHTTCKDIKLNHSKVLKGCVDALHEGGMVLLDADGESMG
ncbi:hypothetical protein ONZ45_g2696 [Pleurotus djamor]|nr:hypothetical protein ONZ45_g2696 [Pleurotus djamor]